MKPNYHRQRRRERRKKFLLLLGGKCNNCGSEKDLHFDHLDPSKKKFNISRHINEADDVIRPEGEKCQLLCDKCHREKTREKWEFLHPEAKHGTVWRYKRYKCRCDLCRKAMSDYNSNKN